MQYLDNLTWAQVPAYVFRKFHSFTGTLLNLNVMLSLVD